MNKATLLISRADMRDELADTDQNFPPRARTALGDFPSNQEMLNAGTGAAATPNREEATFMQTHHARSQQSAFSDKASQTAGHRSLEGAGIGALAGAVIGAAATLFTAVGASFAVPGVDWVIAGATMVALAGAVAGALTGGVVGALLGMRVPVENRD